MFDLNRTEDIDLAQELIENAKKALAIFRAEDCPLGKDDIDRYTAQITASATLVVALFIRWAE